MSRILLIFAHRSLYPSATLEWTPQTMAFRCPSPAMKQYTIPGAIFQPLEPYSNTWWKALFHCQVRLVGAGMDAFRHPQERLLGLSWLLQGVFDSHTALHDRLSHSWVQNDAFNPHGCKPYGLHYCLALFCGPGKWGDTLLTANLPKIDISTHRMPRTSYSFSNAWYNNAVRLLVRDGHDSCTDSNKRVLLDVVWRSRSF